MSDYIVNLNDISNVYGDQVVHTALSFYVKKGEIVGVIGPSGCGKTTLLNTILLLHQPTQGQVNLFSKNTSDASKDELAAIRTKTGVLFQSGALFSSMTVLENIMFPIQNFTALKKDVMTQLALVKLALVGLAPEVAELYPSSLSGGMTKRVAMARAIALDPELIILDEPTAGLDPDSASELDQLVNDLRQYLNLSGVLISHDLETLLTVPDRICFMGDGQILASGSLVELYKNEHPLIQQYFSSHRAKRLLSQVA